TFENPNCDEAKQLEKQLNHYKLQEDRLIVFEDEENLMAKDIKKYIHSCDICQYNKGSTQAPAELLQLLEIPTQP
ncbi:5447_t:CDS:2, partial [Cetraspora pellucida]